MAAKQEPAAASLTGYGAVLLPFVLDLPHVRHKATEEITHARGAPPMEERKELSDVRWSMAQQSDTNPNLVFDSGTPPQSISMARDSN